ncbi:hypothetical protein KQI84_09245 [bacterium]|nr:hypothetical protein [bacterium]
MEPENGKPAHPYRRKAIVLIVFGVGTLLLLWFAVLNPRILSDEFYPKDSDLELMVWEEPPWRTKIDYDTHYGPQRLPVDSSVSIQHRDLPWHVQVWENSTGQIGFVVFQWIQDDQRWDLMINDKGREVLSIYLYDTKVVGGWARNRGDTEWVRGTRDYYLIEEIPPDLEALVEKVLEAWRPMERNDFGRNRRFVWVLRGDGLAADIGGMVPDWAQPRTHQRFPRKGEHGDLAEYAVDLLDAAIQCNGDEDPAKWFEHIPPPTPSPTPVPVTRED